MEDWRRRRRRCCQQLAPIDEGPIILRRRRCRRRCQLCRSPERPRPSASVHPKSSSRSGRARAIDHGARALYITAFAKKIKCILNFAQKLLLPDYKFFVFTLCSRLRHRDFYPPRVGPSKAICTRRQFNETRSAAAARGRAISCNCGPRGGVGVGGGINSGRNRVRD